MEKRKFTMREALWLLALLILAAGIYLWSLLQPAGSTAVIEQNGAELYRVALSSLAEPEQLEVNGTVIELSRAGARVPAPIRSAWKWDCSRGREKRRSVCRSA